MAYLPNLDSDREEMLAAVGLGSADDLFTTIPAELRNPSIDLPPPLAEQDLVAELEQLAARNRSMTAYDNFLGAGVYRRFSPAILRASISRPEFYTAYTPYQAEASQGTLQTIFEFQSMVCALTGLEVANASLYDGATSAAEAMVMAVQATGRAAVAVAGNLHPETLRVLRTFAEGRRIEIDVIGEQEGVVDAAAVQRTLTDAHAAVLVQQPSFLGTLTDLGAIADAAHARGALAVCATDLFACAALAPPGECGFDIAVGDGQPLGIPASFGGPHVGFLAARQALVRRIPGRLVGLTADKQGRRAYTLTLQAREQHIRREHATSNICTNHALIALAATVYMAHMGAGGMRAVAAVSAQRAHHLAERLSAIEGCEPAFPRAPFLWEFVLRCPGDAQSFAARLRERGILAGLPLARVDPARGSELLVCCTETTSPAAIERYAAAAKEFVESSSRSRVAVHA
ncbi:MAG: aminomethyl-transferring glycine dehydrogenase subunit GcvPA [Candidatus Dormibacteraeota bacterium]|nr:aminomethyl-transferring glycine dehydrogenase subunit GcvPA [Candidatus Dormibacteraeota bacterium]MBV9524349.1 aminomethyl-transferring glycine dehydrogenase subunit GcvPA [Candidatus Dormibacteraeota bacterium]